MICTDKRSDHNLDKTTFEWSVNHTTETLACNTSGERIRWARRQKGWLIKTLAAKAGITPEGLSIIERKAGILEMKTLRELAVLLEQPIWYSGCFENMPEDTFSKSWKKLVVIMDTLRSNWLQNSEYINVLFLIGRIKNLIKLLKRRLLYCKILD